jgi:hypothetical protein
MDSIDTALSSAIIATELSLRLVKSIGSGLSGQVSASCRINDSVGNVMIETNCFDISEQWDSSSNQADESTVVWIGTGSSLAAILLGLAIGICVLGRHRLPLSSATSLPKSEIKGFTDSLFSFTEAGPLLSEQNASSSGFWIE